MSLVYGSRVCFVQSGEEFCQGFISRPSYIIFYDLTSENCKIENYYTSRDDECQTEIPKYTFTFLNFQQRQKIQVGINKYSKFDWSWYKTEKDKSRSRVDIENYFTIIPELNCTSANITTCIPSVRINTDFYSSLILCSSIYYVLWFIFFIGWMNSILKETPKCTNIYTIFYQIFIQMFLFGNHLIFYLLFIEGYMSKSFLLSWFFATIFLQCLGWTFIFYPNCKLNKSTDNTDYEVQLDRI